MKSAVFIIGPAGTGKTTLCNVLIDHFRANKTNAYYVNMDPAATDHTGNNGNGITANETLYDIRTEYDFLKIMRTYQLGPNGTLLRILRDFTTNKLSDWLESISPDVTQELLLVDCPGQIETFTHDGHFNRIVSMFTEHEFNIVSLFVLDSTFLTNNNKLLSGLLIALYTMSQLETPFVSIFTKMDLVQENVMSTFDEILENCISSDGTRHDGTRHDITSTICNILDKFGNSCNIPVDITDTDSISRLYIQLNQILSSDDVVDFVDPADPDSIFEETEEN